MKLLKRDKCPLCESNYIYLFRNGNIDVNSLNSNHFKITDSNYGTKWTFYRCRNCSFVFSNPYIAKKDIVEFYLNLEDKEYGDEAEGREKNFITILKRLEKIEKPDKSLLDIGAANGIFLNISKKFGYDAVGIEPSEYLVAEGKERFGVEIFKGTIEEFYSEKRFSVITMLDLIEHLVEPNDIFKYVNNLIIKHGILVIVTPDISSLASKIFRNKWWHYRIAHINFFDLKSLKRILEKNGFEIIKKKRYTWNFSLFYLITRLFPSLKNKKSLQKLLKSINLKIQLFDSLEIYARKV